MVPDTFRNQTILGTVPGVAMLLLGLFKMTSESGATAFIGMGGVLVIVVGVMRPIQRSAWLHSLRSEVPERLAISSRLLTGPAGGFWRFWMHLDANGGDRDTSA